jgi:hypothetical protein
LAAASLTATELAEMLADLPPDPQTEEALLQWLPRLLTWPDQALELARHLLSIATKPETFLALVQALWMLGEDTLVDHGLQQLRQILHPHDPRLLHATAQTRPDPAQRLAAYQHLVEVHPQDKEAWQAILALTR